MRPYHIAIFYKRDGADEKMGFATKGQQIGARFIHVARFVIERAIALKYLIGADYEAVARCHIINGARFRFCQRQRQIFCRAAMGLFQRRLIDAGNLHVKMKSGPAQHAGAHATL